MSDHDTDPAGLIRQEYPLLCVNPNCRPEGHGGPRRTERSNLCDVCADRLRENLRWIADAWPDLLEMLTRETSGMNEPIKGTPDRGMVLNEHASDALRDVTGWVWFLARVVNDEKQPAAGPASSDPDDALRWVAWHSEHFAKHPDADLSAAVAEEAWDKRRAVYRAAYPSGARRLDLGVACREVTLHEDGEQRSCPGSMFVVVVPQATREPDLICTADETHRVEPAQWRRIGWSRKAHPVGVENLLRKLAG